MWHRLVATICHASQALAFWAKKKLDIISRQRSPFTVTLRFAASLKKYVPTMPPVHKPQQTVTFSGCIGSFCNSSDRSSKSTIIIGPSKSVLVYALHSLEYVLGLARFRVFVPKLLFLYDTAEIFSSVGTLRKRFGGLMSNNVNLVRNLVTIARIAASMGRLN